MSYQGEDKWGVYGKFISEDAYTMKELKYKIQKHIMKNYQIGMSENEYGLVNYEITKVSVVIRRKK